MQSRRKAVWGWAMYDWANSAFATTVMSGFFPVYFKQVWSQRCRRQSEHGPAWVWAMLLPVCWWPWLLRSWAPWPIGELRASDFWPCSLTWGC